MPQRLPIALAEVKVGNAFENLLNKICQIIYSLYPLKAKSISQCYKFNKAIKQNGYCICQLRK